MILRKPPKCPWCGEPCAKAVYHELDPNHIVYGDNFSHWDYSIHTREECLKNQRKKKLDNIHDN